MWSPRTAGTTRCAAPVRVSRRCWSRTLAGVNFVDRRGGVTPLMHAAALGSLDTMRLLLDHGADVNAAQRGRRDGVDVGGRRSREGPAPGRTRRRREGGVRERPDRAAARGDERSVSRDGAPAARARRRRQGARSRADVDARRGRLRQRHGSGAAAAQGRRAGQPGERHRHHAADECRRERQPRSGEAAAGGRRRGERRSRDRPAAAGEERHDRSRPVHAADSGVGVRSRRRSSRRCSMPARTSTRRKRAA